MAANGREGLGANGGERQGQAVVSYSLGAVVRLTGLSDHVLRAWERRYGAVAPLRTAGGTRRYRESDVARLRLLAAAVDAGHPIGNIARLPDSELRPLAAPLPEEPRTELRRILEAIEQLDGDEAERLLGLQLAALGPRRFAEVIVGPLFREVGAHWKASQLSVASEHLASACVRNLLGVALRRRVGSARTPPILFTTLAGERHELGVLCCAVIAADLGAHAIYLGPDLPASEIVTATERTRAGVVAVGIGPCAPARQRSQGVRELRRALPDTVALWVGGSGSEGVSLPVGVERIDGLEALDQKVSLLALR